MAYRARRLITLALRFNDFEMFLGGLFLYGRSTLRSRLGVEL
jgi:hypothetical protein